MSPSDARAPLSISLHWWPSSRVDRTKYSLLPDRCRCPPWSAHRGPARWATCSFPKLSKKRRNSCRSAISTHAPLAPPSSLLALQSRSFSFIRERLPGVLQVLLARCRSRSSPFSFKCKVCTTITCSFVPMICSLVDPEKKFLISNVPPTSTEIWASRRLLHCKADANSICDGRTGAAAAELSNVVLHAIEKRKKFADGFGGHVFRKSKLYTSLGRDCCLELR